MLSGGSAVIKYLIFLFNGVFVVTGLAILSVGAVIKGVYWNYHHFLDDKYFSAPNLLIAVGVIVLIVSFLGCCGALKENYCMIVAFTALLILIFILELAGGIAGYVLRDSAKEVLTKSLSENLKHYNEPGYNETTAIWDVIQREFSCCGVNGPSDWPPNGMPLSCCVIPPGTTDNIICSRPAPSNTTSPPTAAPTSSPTAAPTAAPTSSPLILDHFQTGCVESFGNFVEEKAVVIGGAGIGVAVVELLGVVLACRLAIALRRGGM